MTTDITDARAAIEVLHKALTQSDIQLSRLCNRLEDEYSELHAESTSHTNPFNLLHRLRTLQNNLPELRNALISCHQQKVSTVNACQARLQDALSFAKQAQAHDSDSADESSSVLLSQRLEQLNQQIANMFNTFPAVDDSFLQALQAKNGMSNQDFNFAIQSAMSSVTPNAQAEANSTPRDDQQEQSSQNNKPDTSAGRKGTTPTSSGDHPSSSLGGKPKSSKASAKTVQSKGLRRDLSAKSSAPHSSSSIGNSPAFEPVTKAVFNRLPRNLKIHAGKLPEINQFYKKVFEVLVSNPGGMSDKQLMQAMDEPNIQRFEVLRGLTVVRSTKQGWVLAAQK